MDSDIKLCYISLYISGTLWEGKNWVVVFVFCNLVSPKPWPTQASQDAMAAKASSLMAWATPRWSWQHWQRGGRTNGIAWQHKHSPWVAFQNTGESVDESTPTLKYARWVTVKGSVFVGACGCKNYVAAWLCMYTDTCTICRNVNRHIHIQHQMLVARPNSNKCETVPGIR